MKILYVTDLHGDDNKYNKLFKIATEYKPDIVINGGDLLPKEEHEIHHDQKEYILSNLSAHFQVFNMMKIHYLCFPGNDDLMVFDKLFEETCNKYPYVKNIAQNKVKIGDIDFIGMNWVVDYPFRLKDRCRKDNKAYKIRFQRGPGLYSSENSFKDIEDWSKHIETLPTIEEELEMLERPADFSKMIFVSHMPPANMGLDMTEDGRRVGSQALYNFIKKNQPILTLHGHLHESPGISGNWNAKLGKTVCIQPGQSDYLRDLVYVKIDLDKMSYERISV